jgi:hypothetical protein
VGRRTAPISLACRRWILPLPSIGCFADFFGPAMADNPAEYPLPLAAGE